LYLIYYWTIEFVNLQSQYIFMILIGIYLIVTLLINFVSLLSQRWTRVDSDR